VRPVLIGLARLERAFRDEDVRRSSQCDGVFAIAGVGAVTDDPSIRGDPESQRDHGVAERKDLDGERKGGGFRRQFQNPHRIRERRDGERERLLQENSQSLPAPHRAADAEPLPKGKPHQNVKALDVIHMEMAEEQEYRLIALDIPFRPVDAVPGIEKDVPPFRLDERADRVAHLGIVPAVRAQKNDSHIRQPPPEFSR